jgi:hypothetical protein
MIKVNAPQIGIIGLVVSIIFFVLLETGFLALQLYSSTSVGIFKLILIASAAGSVWGLAYWAADHLNTRVGQLTFALVTVAICIYILQVANFDAWVRVHNSVRGGNAQTAFGLNPLIGFFPHFMLWWVGNGWWALQKQRISWIRTILLLLPLLFSLILYGYFDLVAKAPGFIG